jgi:iron-sulfur cluster repair protein YtfE (RIC family)
MITKDMIIREVIAKYPETTSIFGTFKVDFCCGGAHSIEQTSHACGVKDVTGLVTALNEAIAQHVRS